MENNTKKQTIKKEEKKEIKKTLIEEYKEFLTSEAYTQTQGIRGYHIQNNEWRETHAGYGVELEINNDDYNIQCSLSKFLNYKFKMNVENDGSINSNYGMELISQPYTREEWENNKELINQFFDLLKYLNLYENDSTGLHIHISKKLIGKNDAIRENNINKLILIMENYKDQFLKFSRRNKTRLNFCNFMSGYNGKSYKDFYAIKKNKYYSHNTCLNRDAKTYEIRIFKSTTDANTFIATLQFVYNLIDIINREDISDITFNNIINLNEDFKELINYCKENKISNGNKIIDKTKIKEIQTYKHNTRVLKENYNYNRYIEKIRNVILKNLDIYNKSKEEYNENSDLYNNLSYIFTKTYKNNNSIYYQVYEINNLLSNYYTDYVEDLKNETRTEKRVFNKTYKNKYNELYNKLTKLIIDKGGVI